MRKRVDELEKIRQPGYSETVKLIQVQLRRTGDQDWTMMAKETDHRGVLWERRICQELDAVHSKVSSNPVKLETIS